MYWVSTYERMITRVHLCANDVNSERCFAPSLLWQGLLSLVFVPIANGSGCWRANTSFSHSLQLFQLERKSPYTHFLLGE